MIAVFLASGGPIATMAAGTEAPDASPAEAQGPAATAQTNALDEIVITAVRKRGEDVQTTPIAITALNEDLLEQNNIRSLIDIGTLAPNVQIQPASGSGDDTAIYLRGFGSQNNDPASDPHVATFIDGIYQPAVAGALIDLFDIAQLEVDAGPQGTLLGKNAPIGALYVTTAPPQNTFGGEVEADYGSYNHTGLRGKIYGPLVENGAGEPILTGKASFVFKNGGNWIYNEAHGRREFGGEDTKVARLAFSFTPNESFKWDLIASLDQEHAPQQGDRQVGFYGGVPGSVSNATQVKPFECLFFAGGVCPRTAYGTTDVLFTKKLKSDQTEVSSTMSYRFTPITITSVTGLVYYWGLDNADDTGTPFSTLNVYDDRLNFDEETQELRISSNKGGGWNLNDKIDWLVGGYASNYHYSDSNILGILNGSPADPENGAQYANIKEYQEGVNLSYAAFFHVILNFTDQWTGTVGVRRSWDYRTHRYQASGTSFYVPDTPVAFNNTSIEVGTAYQFDANHMAYVRFAQGYESGGFAGFAIGNSYQPEYNNAYEFGLKGDYLDKHLRVNLAFFLNQLSNLQVSSALPADNASGYVQETLNAGAATTQGVEMQSLAVLTDDLTMHLNVGYLQTKYQQFLGTVCSNGPRPADCSGVPFSFAPKWTLNLGEDYERNLPQDLGTATLSANVSFKSSLYPVDPPYPSSFQSGYALVNAGVTFRDPSKKYSLAFYGTNIFDKHYSVGFSDPGGLAQWVSDGRPAEWGIKVDAKF